VRISVLEQLAEDHPSWTLQDAIAHCKGFYDRRAQSVESIDYSSGRSDCSDDTGVGPSQIGGYFESDNDSSHLYSTADPLNMEFSMPGPPYSEVKTDVYRQSSSVQKGVRLR